MDLSETIINVRGYDDSKSYNERFKYFICPRCGKKHSIDDCTILKIRTSCDKISSTVRGRHVTHKFSETFYNIRFCNKCAKVKSICRKILLIIFYLLLPFTFFIIVEFKNNCDQLFSNLIGVFFGNTVLIGSAHAIINTISMKLGMNIDLNHAQECNAIAPITFS